VGILTGSVDIREPWMPLYAKTGTCFFDLGLDGFVGDFLGVGLIDFRREDLTGGSVGKVGRMYDLGGTNMIT
jgi:hypothetical protein